MGGIHYLHDDIAVVGWSCRLPGARSVSEFWSLLIEGRCAISRVPPDRYALQRYSHPRRQERGKSYTWAAGVLDDPWGFDPSVFGISPREAEQMDPQQRLVLELTWEALEDAGIRPSSIAGADVGVYVGASMNEFAHSLYGDMAAADSHFATGMSLAVIANRVSYAFDLHGPSVTIDTACSSSLAALNQAVEALRSGRVDTAVVAGVNVLASPAPFVLFSQAMMLSPTGLCRAFSADADGFVRAEGGVVLVLRKAALAQSNDNPIRGIVLASDMNSDGHTHGISLPSESAQEQLLTRVYSRAGIDPNRLAFVEAHGTGTPAGDPVEAAAIGQSLGVRRSQSLPIGSVKTNVGHLEPASGLVGMLKALLSLNSGILPKTLHFDRPNPGIAFDKLNIAVCDQPLLLPRTEDQCAGVNSFGFGGTNAHVVVGPGRQPVAGKSIASPKYFSISAGSKAALVALADKYKNHLADLSGRDVSVAISAAAHRRDQLSSRAVVTSAQKQKIADALAAFVKGADHPLLTTGEAVGSGLPVAFVYSGNGSQWAGMGRAAYRSSAAFRKRFDEIDGLFQPLGGWSLKSALSAADLADRLKQTSVSQPLIFAIQSAATAALRQQGMLPAVVLGHSVGEVAASEAAGILDLRTAVKVIHFRSMRQELVQGHGRMVAVLASRDAVGPLLASFPDIEIAAINSPRALTLVGPADKLAAFAAAATARGIAALDLDLDYPFHSALMDPIRQPLLESLADAMSRAGHVPFVSTVTGAPLSGAHVNANYWWRNVREPVRFSTAIAQAATLGARYFVEIGPRGMLLKHIADNLDGVVRGFATSSVLSTSDRNNDPFSATISKAIVAGAQLDTAAIFGSDPGGTISLPSYPWQRKTFRYQFTPEAVGVVEREYHPLAGVRYTEDALEWHGHVDTSLLPAYADHRLSEQVVLPGTGFVEMALHVARSWLKSDRVSIAHFEILKALDLTNGQTSELLTRISASTNTIEIYSRPRLSSANWVLNCRSKIQQVHPTAGIDVPIPDKVLARHDPDFIYGISDASGLPYGPAFRLVREVRSHENGLITVDLGTPDGDSPYVLDPVRLDCCTHGIFLVFPEVEAERRGVTYIPVRLEECVLLAAGTPDKAVIEVLAKNDRAILANYYLKDAEGRLLAVLRGVRCQAVALRRPASLDVAGLIEMPRLMDGALTGKTGVELSALDVVASAKAQSLLARDLTSSEPRRLIEGWAMAASYEIACALSESFRVSPALLVKLGRLDEALYPWLVNLLIHLEAAALAREDDGEWTLVQDASLPASESVIDALARERPSFAGELLLMGAVSGLVAKIKSTGAILNTSMPTISPTVLDFYELTPESAAGPVDTLARLFKGLDRPADRALRVLQIGATAAPLVQLAGRNGENMRLSVFEPDSRRVEALRPILGRDGHVTFLKSATEVGLESFDIAVSAAGLHRLSSELLADVQHGLAPGGLLVALEPRPSLFADLVFGLEPGWIRRGMAGYPLSSQRLPESWASELGAAGFAGVRTANVACHSEAATLIVAEKGVAPAPRAVTAAKPRSITIVEQPGARETELAATLARLLAADGHDAVVIEEATPTRAADIVVHFPALIDEPLGPMERLAARCLDMKACAEGTKDGSTLWLVFFGALSHPTSAVRPVEAGAWAFGRTIANEFAKTDVRRIDVLPHVSPQMAAGRIRDIVLSGTDETELQIDVDSTRAVRVDSAHKAIASAEGPAASAARLERHSGPGQRLQWRPIERVTPVSGQIELEVEATGVNFRDLMWMLSLLPDDILEDGFSGPTMGLECAGKIARVGPDVKQFAVGDRVVGLAGLAFATHVTAPAVHFAKLPDGMPSEAAATIPVAFFTAHYALIRLAQLKRDEWVLIHGGAGGVGMAAIQIARGRGAKIIATAGSPAKRALVKALGVDHVLDSRSHAFADEVHKITGSGVDVVLNSLAGEAMERSIACLRPFGRFVELGKRDYVNNTHLGLRPFRKNLSYFGVDLDQLMVARRDIGEKVRAEVMRQFEKGALTPLLHTVFSADNVGEAFRVMQQSSHVGKIVVRPPQPGAIRIPPKPFEPNVKGTHLITGAFGGFGLETAKWLVDKGVRHLVMIGRRGPGTAAARSLIDDFTSRGVSVLCEACDVSDRNALEQLFARMKLTMPRLAGVIHAAMVLEDVTLANLDIDRLHRVLEPKVKGAEHLHALTRKLSLDYFVLFSTLVTLIGNAGQGNYVAANAYMEGLARRRRQEGLPAIAIGWGPIADVGVLVRKQLLESSIQKLSGVRGMTAREGLELMAQALAQPADSLDFAAVTIAPNDGGFGGAHLPVLRSPTYAALARGGAASRHGAAQRIDVSMLIETESREAVQRAVADGIVVQLARVMHARDEDISRLRPLGEIGLDSLMALELSMSLEGVFGAHVSLVGAVGRLSVGELAGQIVAQFDGARKAEPSVALAEHHVGTVDAAHVDVIKGILDEDEWQRKGSSVGAKKLTSG